jgi:hypothetical protein
MHPNQGAKMQKMLENCVKMECIGCRKLIPTHLFYDHLNPCENNNSVAQSQNNISQIIGHSPAGYGNLMTKSQEGTAAYSGMMGAFRYTTT